MILRDIFLCRGISGKRGELFQNQAESKACGKEGNPAHAVLRQRKRIHERRQRRRCNFQEFQCIVQRGKDRESHSQGIDPAGAVGDWIGQSQNNQRHRQRVQEKQHRDGALDDGGQAEEGNAEGKESKAGGPGLMSDGRHELVEESSAGSNQADACGQAGQNDDGPQNGAAEGTEVEAGRADQNGSAVFHMAQDGYGGRAQIDESSVDDEQEERGNEAALEGSPHLFLRIGDAVQIDRFQNDNAENKTGENVHGVVPFQKRIGKGFHRCIIGCSRFGVSAHGGKNRCADQDEKEKKERRRDDLPDAGHQLGRGNRQPPGQKEENSRKGVEREILIAFRKKRSDCDFKGSRRRTGNGKERSDGQVQGAAEKKAVKGGNPAGQVHQAFAGAAHRQNGSEGKSYAGNDEADDGIQRIVSCILPEKGGENQIARSEEQSKEKKTDGNIFMRAFFHKRMIPFLMIKNTDIS